MKKIHKFLYFGTVVSFLIPIIYLVIRMIFGESTGLGSDAGYHSDADYLLMLFQCILGLVTIHIPSLLEKNLRFEIPGMLYGFYIVFLYGSIFLGEVRSFYYLVPHWDSIMHFLSSVMTGFFGLMVVTILNRDERVAIRLSPIFVVLFAFSFSVMIGAVWEVLEYVIDGVLGVNMQKFITADGTVLVGRAALSDTMKDIIIDILGAFLASIIGYFSIRRNLRWYIPVLKHGESENKMKPSDNAEV
ncbi:MAG TPA: hypothetical protein GX701_07535 [Clostridiales bacterium]|jgi:uncharacterized membrane protein YjdF|nr:hypothetical protein [Clostridiales bacterium]